MTATILALVLASSALHPLREFFIKGDATPSGVTLAVVFQCCILAALQVWPAMLVSGLAILFYYWCLVLTLRIGDLSIDYPITRSSPLFVVGAPGTGHRGDHILEIRKGVSVVTRLSGSQIEESSN